MCAASAFADGTQENEGDVTCDTVKYRISYELSFVKDTLRNPIKPIKEKMLLEIGDSVSHFYSYKVFQDDSLNNELFKKGITSFTRSGQVQWQTYKNYPKAGLLMQVDRTVTDKFVTINKIETPEWKLCPDSSSAILGYKCSLATTYFKGRKWSAWYTEDIPLEDGPWKLGGLPGLILKAYDSGRQYVFECSGMQQPQNRMPIIYKSIDAEEVSAAEMKKALRRYHKDPVGYAANTPNVRTVVKDANGNVIKNYKIPYNPIEREE